MILIFSWGWSSNSGGVQLSAASKISGRISFSVMLKSGSISDTLTVSSDAKILGYSLAYDANDVKSSTIASLRPPEETPSTVDLMHGGNASGFSFPA
jgi:hypothetical protein